MGIIVFGTGVCYQRYKECLRNIKIIVFADNDKEKQGKSIDGIRVISPERMQEYDFSHILILVQKYNAICRQLMALGIDKDKMITFDQLSYLVGNIPYIQMQENQVKLNQWLLQGQSSKNILLISHDFSYTGVPVALMNMGIVLKKMGYHVAVMALRNGNFTRELQINNVDYSSNLEIYYKTTEFKEVLKKVDLVIVGTLDLYYFIREIIICEVPIMWWIHESEYQFYLKAGAGCLTSEKNIHYYGGGNRVIRMFRENNPLLCIDKLQYCIPDKKLEEGLTRSKQDKLVFAVIGTITRRKAQDIAIKALKELPDNYRKRMELWIIGKEPASNDAFWSYIEGVPEISLLGELSQRQLELKFDQLDVLLCPSREDPMPIVVTQAMMYERVCVVSENVGQAEFIRQGENGFLINNEDVEGLADVMREIFDHRAELGNIGKRARDIFKKEFSQAVMMRSMEKIIRTLCD